MFSLLSRNAISLRTLLGDALCLCILSFSLGAQAGPPMVIPPSSIRNFPYPPHRYTPPPPPSLIVDVKGGEYHSLALDADGTVWAWGENNDGQLGNGLFQTFGPQGSATPARVHNLLSVTAIAAGDNHSLALKSNGTVWAWGNNDFGELGNGATTNSATPVQVSALTNVTVLAAGSSFSMALKSDGTVWAWGENNDGQLGNGTTVNSASPVQVKGAGGVGFLTNVFTIAAGGAHCLALKSDGTVWGWGDNGYGAVGNGATTNTSTPVQASGLSNVVAIAASSYHSLAVTSDGTVWAWGYNDYGELGNGSVTLDNPTPGQVSGLTNAVGVAAGRFHSLAIKSDGTVWAWGRDADGELGDGTMTNSATPEQVSDVANITAIACGGFHTLVLDARNTVWTWGDNAYGELGAGSFTDPNDAIPEPLDAFSGVVALAGGGLHSLALNFDGTVSAWGDNADGQLGNGAFTTVGSRGIASPGTVAGAGGIGILTGIVAIAGGYFHSLALKSDGTVWAWGSNDFGQLGNGAFTGNGGLDGSAIATPVLVSELSGIVAIAGGAYHNLALKSDGTVWAWGDNGVGELGNGTFTGNGGVYGVSIATPMQVSGLSNVIAICAGAGHSMALKSDGTVWAWGYNFYGQLGNGAFTTTGAQGIATPVQVSGLSGVVAIAGGGPYSLALTSNGKAWAWGENDYGQLGDGTTNNSATPALVIVRVPAVAIAAGYPNGMALTSDGMVWAWGYNGYGELGNGAFTDPILTPVQVSAISNVVVIANGGFHSLAQDSNSTVWAWGENDYGELGNGAFTPISPFGIATPGLVIHLE